MKFYPARLSVLFVFLFSVLNSQLLFSEEQSSSEPLAGEAAMPEGYAALLQDEQHPVYEPSRRPYREIAIDTERAGIEQYYYQGSGFKLTDFFGIGASYEYFDEGKKPHEMSTVAGLELPNYPGGIPKEILKRFAEPTETQNIIAAGTIDAENLPRFRYTFTNKEFDVTFVNTSENEWNVHNFDLLQQFEMFHRDGFLTLNPIYERRYTENKTSGSESVEDLYIFQYVVFPHDKIELFGQVIGTDSDQRGGPEKSDSLQFRVEPRILFSGIKLKVITGWFHDDKEASPGDVEGSKDEFYVVFGKDIARHWRGTLRLDYVTTEDDLNEANIFIEAESFGSRGKISYEWQPGWDISVGAEYWEDLSDFDQFSFYGFLLETEFIRYGLFRSTASVQWNNYYDIDTDEVLFNVRVHAFRF